MLALYAGLFSLALNVCRFLPSLAFGLLGGSIWASLEALREVLFTGFPWLTLASAFSPWPLFIQSASVIGGFGLGALFAAVAVWLVHSGVRPTPDKAIAILAMALVLGYGYQTANIQPVGQNATACVVQGNIDQSLKWDPAYQEGTVSRYITLSRGAIAKQRPDIIIWPETALPFYLQDISEMGASVRAFVHQSGIPLITGTPAYTYLPQKKDYTLYNRAYLISPGSAHMAAYDKVHLLPFGEYMPLAEYVPFGKFVEAVGDFAAGQEHTPLCFGNLAMGMLICYEAIFPELAQLRVSKGANMLVNISNDAWFGRSSAAMQHLYLSSLRAVEQQRWLVRCTNTGISAFVSPKGQIISATQMFTATAAMQQITLLNTKTFFHRNYQAIRWLVIALAILLLTWGIAANRRCTLR